MVARAIDAKLQLAFDATVTQAMVRTAPSHGGRVSEKLGCGLLLDPVQRARDRGAFVLDVIEACRLGDPARLVRADIELQPQRLRADRNRLPRDLRRVRRRPEHVHQVDLLGHLGQRTVDTLAEECVGVRVDWDDAKASLLKPGGHRTARFARVPRSAHDGDHSRRLQDLVPRLAHDNFKPSDWLKYSPVFTRPKAELARNSRQPDDWDLAIRLACVLAVLGRNGGDASQRLFALTPVQRIASDLHLPAAHLEPDLVRVLDHVVEPRRMSGGSTL